MTASRLISWITDKTEENQRKTPRDLDKLFNPPFTMDMVPDDVKVMMGWI